MKNRPFEQLPPTDKRKITLAGKEFETSLSAFRRRPTPEMKEAVQQTRVALASLLDGLMGESALDFERYDTAFREATEILNGVSKPSQNKPLNHWAPLPGDEVYADIPDGRESMIND